MISTNADAERLSALLDVALGLAGAEMTLSDAERAEAEHLHALLEAIDVSWQASPEVGERVRSLVLRRLAEERPEHPWVRDDARPDGDSARADGETYERGIAAMIEHVGASEAPVLIYGPKDARRQMLAAAIHRNSPRRTGPFVAVNCAALDGTPLEVALFGRAPDVAGRLDLARGGTILLEEVEALSLGVQKRLLRVLREREFERFGGTTTIKTDVRVIVATSRDLRAEADAGRFRDDLFHRLSAIMMTVPPSFR